MASTQRFGFEKFGQGGAISDNNFKFSSRDRDTLDSLLWSLFHHDHGQEVGVTSIQGPVHRPVLSLLSSGGTIPAGTTFHYRIAYRDAYGNETEASIQTSISTPAPIAPPQAPDLSTAATGGLLGPGTYRYALAFTQAGGARTRAPNVSNVIVPEGTVTNTVTVSLPTLPDGATGWNIYRRDPAADDYYFLTSVGAGATEYVDDGSAMLDCNIKRPNTNTTNSANRIQIAIDPNDLPLSTLVSSWRIYRTTVGGVYNPNSLVAQVTDTQTEGGVDLVTSFIDTGQGTSAGMPLEQTSAPPVIPGIDGSTAFAVDSGRLPGSIAPWRVRQYHTFIPGEITDATVYNQSHLYEDMTPARIEATFLTAPSGVDGSNHGVVRVKDTALVDAVHYYWTDAEPQDEEQTVTASSDAEGSFALVFDSEETDPITLPATATDLATALEANSNITSVFVYGTGTSTDPWVVRFIDPGSQDVPEMTVNSTGLTAGSVAVATSISGSNGGTFTLSDGVDTTNTMNPDVDAATLKTRLETDITSITTVSVTGTGTFEDPWVVTFTNPGATHVPLLDADVTLLNGAVDRTMATRGHGNTVIDLEIDSTASHHVWFAPDVINATEYASDMFSDGGVEVSDAQAETGVAVELDTANDYVSWNVGVMDPGDYVVRFWVADVDETATFEIAVYDYNTGTVTSVVEDNLTPQRSAYTPAYELDFTADGVMDIAFQVTHTSGGLVRVDRIQYEAVLDVFLAGETLTVEGVVTGAPTNAGENVQVNIWH